VFIELLPRNGSTRHNIYHDMATLDKSGPPKKDLVGASSECDDIIGSTRHVPSQFKAVNFHEMQACLCLQFLPNTEPRVLIKPHRTSIYRVKGPNLGKCWQKYHVMDRGILI
jgi:hypothetical protein